MRNLRQLAFTPDVGRNLGDWDGVNRSSFENDRVATSADAHYPGVFDDESLVDRAQGQPHPTAVKATEVFKPSPRCARPTGGCSEGDEQQDDPEDHSKPNHACHFSACLPRRRLHNRG